MNDVPEFDKTRAYSLNTSENKINTYDQNGHLYDGLTLLPLENLDPEKYSIPKGAPFSRVKTTQERIEDAINTIRASGTIDADTLTKFDRMFKNMLIGGGPSQDQPTPHERRPLGLRKDKSEG